MSVKSVLVMKVTNGSPGAYRLVEATPQQIGSNFGSDEAVPATFNGTSKIIQFSNGTGANKVLLVAWVGFEVYAFDGTTWTLVHTVANGGPGGNAYFHAGMHIVYVNNEPLLVGVYQGASPFHWHAWKTKDGINFSEVADIFGNVGSIVHAELVFKNVLYWACETSPGHMSWDPASNATTRDAAATITANGQAMCTFKNNLYKVAQYTVTPGYWLWGLSSGTWSPIVALGNGANGSPANDSSGGKPILYDGGDGYLYAIYQTWNSGASQWGWLNAQIDVTAALTATSTDVSSDTLPAGWAYGASPTLARLARWRVLVEMESDPSVATVHLWVAAAASGVAWNYYTWNGPATLIGASGAADDTGGDSSMHLAISSNTDSDYIWVPSDFDIRIVSQVPTSGGIIVNFLAFGPVGNESKTMTLWRNTEDQITEDQCHLSNPGVLQTTIAAGSNGVNVNTFAGAGTLHATDTTGFPSQGSLYVATGSGNKTVTYTGISGNDFTNCTCSSSGVLSTGGALKSGPGAAPTLNANTIQIDGVTADGNTATPTIYSVVFEAGTDGVSTAQRVRLTPAIS